MNKHTHTHIQTYVHKRTYTNVHTQTYIHKHTYMDACKRTYTNIHTQMYMREHNHIHTYIHTQTYTHTYYRPTRCEVKEDWLHICCLFWQNSPCFPLTDGSLVDGDRTLNVAHHLMASSRGAYLVWYRRYLLRKQTALTCTTNLSLICAKKSDKLASCWQANLLVRVIIIRAIKLAKVVLSFNEIILT